MSQTRFPLFYVSFELINRIHTEATIKKTCAYLYIVSFDFLCYSLVFYRITFALPSKIRKFIRDISYMYIIIAVHVQDGTAHWQRADRKDFSGQIHRPLRRQGILYEEILRVASWRILRRYQQENSFSEIGGFLHTNLSLHVETNKRLNILLLNSFAISFD